jgi:hypothetical protein
MYTAEVRLKIKMDGTKWRICARTGLDKDNKIVKWVERIYRYPWAEEKQPETIKETEKKQFNYHLQ